MGDCLLNDNDDGDSLCELLCENPPISQILLCNFDKEVYTFSHMIGQYGEFFSLVF